MARIAESFFSHAQQSPEKLAVWCEGSELSYAELATLVRRWGKEFRCSGIDQGDPVGVVLENSIAFVVLMLVAADLGLVLVPVSTALPPKAMAGVLHSASVKHIVAGGDVLLALETLGNQVVPGVWVSVDDSGSGLKTLSKDYQPVKVDSPEPGGIEDTSPYILTMTSGSTGQPKPIILSQKTKYERALSAIDLYGISANDVILAATPLYHSLAERLALIALISGATLIVKARFSVSQWMACVTTQRVSFTIAVSSQLKQIAQALSEDESHFPQSLRSLVSSSALLDPAVKHTLVNKFGCELHECYGTSEIAIATNLDLNDAGRKLNSVGKPIPGVDVLIIDEHDRPLPPGEIGEIVCRTPFAFQGYYHRDEQTEKANWHGYFRTGDVGKLDRDGFLYFLGRKKELIISGGINIYPGDIEDATCLLPEVSEAAAFAIDDATLGEAVAVAVVPRDGAEISLRKLRRHSIKHLADFQIPRKLLVVETLPRNAMGKLMRTELKAMLAEKREACCA